MTILHAMLRFTVVLAAASGSILWGQEPPADSRGQAPDVGTGNLAPAPSGTLEILLEPVDLRGGSRQVQDARRPRIRIYQESGRFIREVVAVSTVEGRETVDLPPGKYLVEVRSPETGKRTFRATVAQDHETVVDPARVEGGNPEPVPDRR